MKRCYTFEVYITADAATDAGDGWTQDEIFNLIKTTLSYYSGPLAKQRDIEVDFQLMSDEEVPDGR